MSQQFNSVMSCKFDGLTVCSVKEVCLWEDRIELLMAQPRQCRKVANQTGWFSFVADVDCQYLPHRVKVSFGPVEQIDIHFVVKGTIIK